MFNIGEAGFEQSGLSSESRYNIEGLDDKNLRQLVKVHPRRQNGVGRGAGVVQPDLLHGADDQPGGLEPAQAGGHYQIAAEKPAVGGQVVQP